MYQLDLFKSIPNIPMPNIENVKIVGNNDNFICLNNEGFKCESIYYKQQLDGSLKNIYVRETVQQMLMKANALLKDYNVELLCFDGFRPIKVQQTLWNKYYKENLKRFPYLEDFEVKDKTKQVISYPSYDESKPSLHNTGGAIDVTLIDRNGNELDMGTHLGEISDRTYTFYYERLSHSPTSDFSLYSYYQMVKQNRRLLYNTMLAVGFTNLPSKWWHYDYGDNAWGYYKQTKALYDGVLECKDLV